MVATERLYTPQEVADILQVHQRTVHRWLREGQLKGRKIGNLWRVSESSLDEFTTGKEGE